jgi:DNA-binding NtrC family response regulator
MVPILIHKVTMQNILVVSGDGDGLVHMVSILNAAGYETSGASTFEEAREMMAYRSPDLVIADQRLGAFNGLHLIVSVRASHPGVSGIVTTPAKNHGLEDDARGLDIECMVTPPNPAEWLGPISKALNSERRAPAPS